MEEIRKYQDIIEKEFKYQQSIPISNAPNVKRHLIINKDRTEFLLLNVGFVQKSYRHYPVFHVEIKNEQIIIHQDATDIPLAYVLEDAGIPKEKIVLGHLSKFMQEVSDYAVAA